MSFGLSHGMVIVKKYGVTLEPQGSRLPGALWSTFVVTFVRVDILKIRVSIARFS